MAEVSRQFYLSGRSHVRLTIQTRLPEYLRTFISACITSILRFYSTYILTHNPDLTYIIAKIETWCAIESNTAIMCACMQSLKPLLDKIIPKWRRQDQVSTNRSRHSRNYARSWKIWKVKGTPGHSSTGASSTTFSDLNAVSLPDLRSYTSLRPHTEQRV